MIIDISATTIHIINIIYQSRYIFSFLVRIPPAITQASRTIDTMPAASATLEPTAMPTYTPTQISTLAPTLQPTFSPTISPTVQPSEGQLALSTVEITMPLIHMTPDENLGVPHSQVVFLVFYFFCFLSLSISAVYV